MKKISALLLALCMALSLAACGSKDPDTAASLPPAPSGTESGAPSTARALGGDLVLPFTSTMGEFFNPYKQGNLIEYGWPCYEPLAQLKPDGQWHPCLAESWEVDGEGHTITVKLRQGVTFHNGDTLDADDLVFTLQSRLDYGTASAIGNPSAVEKVDDYTVRVRWDAFSLDYELWILKEYVYSKSAVEDNGLDWILNNMVGTGPYVMSEFIPDVHLRFTRSDSYWREIESGPDTITFQYFPEETTRLAAFLNGEIGTIDTIQSTSIAHLEAAGFVGNSEYNTNNITHYYVQILNLDENDPLADVEVRRALYLHGIDWDYVAEAASGGLGHHNDCIGSERMAYYSPELEQSAYDPEKAKQMLADAGYPDGFETVLYIYPGLEKDATLIQADLEKIGVRSTVEVVDASVVWNYMTGYVDGVESGIFPQYLSYDSSFQTDRFIKFNSPEGAVAEHTVWDDEGVALWNAVKTAKTHEEQNDALRAFVEYYVLTDCTYWPMYNVEGKMYYQEDVHYSDMAPIVGAGYDPLEIWMDVK